MAQIIEFNGAEFEFPDEATQDQIYGYLRKQAGMVQGTDGKWGMPGEEVKSTEEQAGSATAMDETGMPVVPQLPKEATEDLVTTDASGMPEVPNVADDRFTETGDINPDSKAWEGMSSQQVYDAWRNRDKKIDNVIEEDSLFNQLKSKARSITSDTEAQGAGAYTTSDDLKIDSESDIDKMTQEKMKANPELSFSDARDIAENEYSADRAELGANLALMAVPGGNMVKAGGKLRSVARGAETLARPMAEGVAAGMAGNVVGGRDLMEGTGEDALYSIAGALAGKAIGTGVEVTTKTAKAIKNAVTGSDSKLVKSSIAKLNDLGTKTDEIISKAGGKVDDAVYNTVIPGTDNIKVGDVLDMRTKAGTMGDIQRAGGKVGVSNVSEQMNNKELKDLLAKTESGIAKVVGKIPSPINKSLGIDAIDKYSSRVAGAKKKLTSLEGSIKRIEDELRSRAPWGKLSPTAEGMVTDLKTAARSAKRGNYMDSEDASKAMRGKLNAAKGAKGKDKEAIDAFADINKQIQATRKLVEKGDESNAITDLIMKMAAPAVFGGAAYSESGNMATTGTVATAALLGRKGLQKALSSRAAKRLAEVEKALGGKINVDQKTLKLLESTKSISSILSKFTAREESRKDRTPVITIDSASVEEAKRK